MARSSVTVTKSGPGIRSIQQALERLRKSDVYVGIPAFRTLRKDEEMNNATLMFIQEKGSPINNIPPRPVIQPGIDDARALIAPELAAGAKSMLDERPAEVTLHLKRAGMIAVNSVKRQFGSSDLAPNAPSTIARKGSDKPLIDKVELRRAVTFVVSEASGAQTEAENLTVVHQPNTPSRPGAGIAQEAEEAIEEVAEL